MTRVPSKQFDYSFLRGDNEKTAALINEAWGEKVAWVEDRAVGALSMPVVVSHLVNGKLPWRSDVPAFFAGPAFNRIR